MTDPQEVRDVGRVFDVPSDFIEAVPCGKGHINDTFVASYRNGTEVVRYVHQRLNHNIFRDPASIMSNIERVLAHLREKLSAEPDVDRRVLRLVPTRDGRSCFVDPKGEVWRTYAYIGCGRTFDVVESPRQAYESAKAFGLFQKLLADLPGPRLHDTLPGFHDTPARLAALRQAVSQDKAGRVSMCRKEIDFALSREADTRLLLDLLAKGEIPERVVHNDTKLNNVIMDDTTREALCVLDLDTVMPGLSLHDFGDMVRTTTSPAAEDEQDLSKVGLEIGLFEGLTRGYLGEVGDLLNSAELEHLAVSGKVITLETGIRFLTDFLSGDVYFKVSREAHNLDRCRTQFRLVESIESQLDQMNRVVEAAQA